MKTKAAKEKKQQSGKFVTKIYNGGSEKAITKFKDDCEEMVKKSYVPTSQSWIEGSWRGLDFLIALTFSILFIVLALIIFYYFIFIVPTIFIYMLIVKPRGSLCVTYELQGTEKIYPACAEEDTSLMNNND